jgi:4-amino-4-deoxy-L-arabinose transferase
VIDSKQPQFMVDIIGESLAPSRYVLSNNVGIAAGLAGTQAQRYHHV